MSDKDSGERLATIETKVEMVLIAIDKLVSKAEYEELKRRVDKMEAAPTRWLPIFIAGAALLLQFLKP